LVQGRARPTLAQLYNWRYKELGDLPNVCSRPEYIRANPGFSYDYQFINVGDVDGRGESEPIPYFYQVPTSATSHAHCNACLKGCRIEAQCETRSKTPLVPTFTLRAVHVCHYVTLLRQR
jgi:hypothetical protein